MGAIELVRVGREGRHVRVPLLLRVATWLLAGQVASLVPSRAAAGPHMSSPVLLRGLLVVSSLVSEIVRVIH